MKVEKFETIRVRFEDDYYCDITPCDDAEGMYEFWLYRSGYDASVYMFGCEAKDEDEAVELAVSNVPDYIQYLN